MPQFLLKQIALLLLQTWTKFNGHQIFTWWLRISSCGSWENCLERNPEVARLPTLVPQRRPGSLQLTSSVLDQDSWCNMANDSWIKLLLGRHVTQAFSSQEPEVQAVTNVCKSVSEQLDWISLPIVPFPLLLLGKLLANTNPAHHFYRFCDIDVKCLNRHFLLLNTLSVCPIKNSIYWTTLCRLFVPS